MKGDYSGFGSSGNYVGASDSGGSFKNGSDYNTAGSKDVGQVDSIQTVSNLHSKPVSSTPNSVIKNYKNGKLSSERYYGKDGRPYLDIDYTNHGNAKTHPHVPHQHKISFQDGKMHREKTEGRIKND